MKTSKILLVTLCFFLYASVNAQVFVGGGFGFSTSGGQYKSGSTTTDKPTAYSFSFAPKLGTFISDKVAIGAEVDLSLAGTKTFGNIETVAKNHSFGISPFLRYYAVTLNKFSVFGQGNVGVIFSGSSNKVGGTTTDGPKGTSLFIRFVPGLAYNVSDKLSLETSLNILGFGYSNTTLKDEDSNKEISSNFTIGAGLDNIVTVGTISVGAIYKF